MRESTGPSNNNATDSKEYECNECSNLLFQALGATRPFNFLQSMNAVVSIQHKKKINDKKSDGKQNTQDEVGPCATIHIPKVERVHSSSPSMKNEERSVTERIPETYTDRIHALGNLHNGNATFATSSSTQLESYVRVQVECKWCGTEGPEGGARAYVKGPSPMSIVLCANRLGSQKEIEEVLVHELIHVYDVNNRKMNLKECEKLAHSEIRAAREAECHGSFSLFRDHCVMSNAITATRNMFPYKKAKECVTSVFDKAIRDFEPLEFSMKNEKNVKEEDRNKGFVRMTENVKKEDDDVDNRAFSPFSSSDR